MPGSWCRDYKGVSVEVRRRMRLVQCSGGARAQCSQRLVLMQLTREISRCSSVDGSASNGPELEVNTLMEGSQCSCRRSSVALERRGA